MPRLLVVSHTPHYIRDGRVVGWGATVREIDQLAARFSTVRHVAVLYPGTAPDSAIRYEATNVELVPVPPAGAEGFLGKLDALRAVPTYARTITRELPTADVVHVRAPANIALVAMSLLALRREPRKRWFKFAGNWRPEGRESPSYKLQRRWLESGRLGGVVSVNGAWPRQPAFIRTFYNPSLSDDELERGRRAAEDKHLGSPLELLFIGQLLRQKGAARAIEIVGLLRDRSIDVRLKIIGDGPERAACETLAKQQQLEVTFSGWQPPRAVHDACGRAHILILPSETEGWPKVLSEGMASGAVPIAGAVGSIASVLEELSVGRAVPATDVRAYADAIGDYVAAPLLWQDESRRAVACATRFSFAHYLGAVDDLLRDLDVSE